MHRQWLLSTVWLVVLLAGCRATPEEAAGTGDPVHEAPGCPDLPSSLPVEVPVPDGRLTGRLYLASGEGRGATVAWFHGFPGLPEPTPELVTALTGAGLNLLYVHYRGAWGSPGAFGAASAIEDAGAALAFLRDPEATHACRVDPEAIIAAGDSFGSWVALHAAARNPRVACAAAALVVDLGALGTASEDAGVRAGFSDMFAAVDGDPALGFQLRGGAEGLMAELIVRREANALPSIAGRFANRPILLVGAEDDQLAPPAQHLQPFAETLAANGAHVTTRMFPGGHELADAAYARVLLQWLRETCPVR